MNFREFYLQEDARHYVLFKDRGGEYHVLGTYTQNQLPDVMQNVKHANNPVGIWTYNTAGGKLALPRELERDREPILMAHYSRMGFNKPAMPEPKVSDDSDYYDPDVFNPNYGSQWKRMEPVGTGTASYHGRPLASGMPTPQPPAFKRT